MQEVCLGKSFNIEKVEFSTDLFVGTSDNPKHYILIIACI